MKAFEYASPHYESDLVELLSPEWGDTEILAGGTDLVGLMKKMIVTPRRVVNILDVASLRGIECDSEGVTLGATTRLDEILDSPDLDEYPSIKQAIRGINSMQLQCQGTLAGELLQRPRCWYFRGGHGLLGANGRMIAEGENQYHAIFGNAGPAKFVHPSRLAPALVALGAIVRVIGPAREDVAEIPLDRFFRAPHGDAERESILLPNQIVTHIHLPPTEGGQSGSYEVRHGEGPDYPLVSAAANVRVTGGRFAEAQIVLGHVAPTPWVSHPAVEVMLGREATPETAKLAGEAAVLEATPLSNNEYKVHLARVAVERAILTALGLPTGGF